MSRPSRERHCIDAVVVIRHITPWLSQLLTYLGAVCPLGVQFLTISRVVSTTFAIGLTKLTQEYEEFAARQIEGFQIICDDDDEDSDEDMGITCDPWDLRILF